MDDLPLSALRPKARVKIGQGKGKGKSLAPP